LLLLAGCAQAPTEEKSVPAESPPAAALPALPATYVNKPGCPGCLEVTLTLRADGSYFVREILGASEFYDFGRWRHADGVLELVGGRDAPRRYVLRESALDSQAGTQGGDLTRAPRLEKLRGPFRLTGLYDGATFRECRTGLAWQLDQTRAAAALKEEYLKRLEKPALVMLDAQFEGAPEVLRVLRPAAVLNARACPAQ
jgi:hypothetical protein